MMIPLILRTTEEMLVLVPNSYREAAFALGIPHWKIVLHIVLKTARKGIITGILLAAARVAGETRRCCSRLWATAFGAATSPSRLKPCRCRFSLMPSRLIDDAHRQAWAGALVLILFVLALNIGVRVMTRGHTPNWQNEICMIQKTQLPALKSRPGPRHRRAGAETGNRRDLCRGGNSTSGLAATMCCAACRWKSRPKPSPRSSVPAAAASPPSCAP